MRMLLLVYMNKNWAKKYSLQSIKHVFYHTIQNPYCDNCQTKSFIISCFSRIQLNKQCVHLVNKKNQHLKLTRWTINPCPSILTFADPISFAYTMATALVWTRSYSPHQTVVSEFVRYTRMNTTIYQKAANAKFLTAFKHQNLATSHCRFCKNQHILCSAYYK